MLVEELTGEPPTISDDALDVLYLDHVQFLVARGESPVTDRLALAPGTGEAVAPGLLALRHAFEYAWVALRGQMENNHASKPPDEVQARLRQGHGEPAGKERSEDHPRPA